MSRQFDVAATASQKRERRPLGVLPSEILASSGCLTPSITTAAITHRHCLSLCPFHLFNHYYQATVLKPATTYGALSLNRRGAILIVTLVMTATACSRTMSSSMPHHMRQRYLLFHHSHETPPSRQRTARLWKKSSKSLEMNLSRACTT